MLTAVTEKETFLLGYDFLHSTRVYQSFRETHRNSVAIELDIVFESV